MKLCNFLRYDPSYKGSGLTRGGKLEEAIWTEFSGDTDHLHQIAAGINKGIAQLSPAQVLLDEDEEEFPEGRVLYRLHRQKERNRALVAKAKAQAEKRRELCCIVCGFDFFVEYGEIGKGFIECHHTVPISEYTTEKKTRLIDLALVCANCHRMLHRGRPWLSIEELSRLRDNDQSARKRKGR